MMSCSAMGFVRNASSLSTSEGKQVHSVDRAVLRKRNSRGSRRSRVDIEAVNRSFDDPPGRNSRRPLQEVGHVNSTLEEADLPATEGTIHLGQADVVRAAVVGGEEDQGVLFEAVSAQRIEYATDASVEGAHHRGVDPKPMILDLR